MIYRQNNNSLLSPILPILIIRMRRSKIALWIPGGLLLPSSRGGRLIAAWFVRVLVIALCTRRPVVAFWSRRTVAAAWFVRVLVIALCTRRPIVAFWSRRTVAAA